MRELIAAGWDVHLVTDPSDGFERLRDIAGLTLHALPMKRPPAPLHDLRSLMRWRRLLKSLRPDVVVAGTPKAGLLGMLAARMQGVQTRVYHLRGLRYEGLSGLSRFISLRMEHLTASRATVLLCDAPSMRAAVIASGLAGAERTIVLGAGSACGVELDRFHLPTNDERQEARELFDISPAAFVIGFVGRITEDKGIAELLRAAAAVHAAHPQVVLLLVGPIEEPHGLDAEELLLLGEAWVRTLGYLQEPSAAYRAMDIYCLPSHREGFPISPLEAMASGLPIVSTDATGCIDAVRPGITGLVVPVRDTAKLTEALLSIVENPELGKEMGIQGRAWVSADFDSRQVTRNFIAYMTSLISEQGTTPTGSAA
ncbi:MAG TPA: glycosyltransferase family 1 protein [Actinobacteria bacterium]|nr:glycosyltransferase family 1 protein [Actinomycetota bacterium]